VAAGQRRDRVPPPGDETKVRDLAPALRRAAEWLEPHRERLLEDWVRAVAELRATPEADVREACARALDGLLEWLSKGDVHGLLAAERDAAARETRHGRSLLAAALDIRVLDRCLAPVLETACPDRESLAETLVAFDELGDRRLEALLVAQEDEATRRLIEAQELAARAAEKAREVRRAYEALRRAEAESAHRAEQISLLASVAHRIAPIREPDALMQQAADQIRARMNHSYVAVVVLDHEGVLVGRWAGRPGLGRSSAGRAQSPPGGVIGRAIRLRAPQVVGDVAQDPDYHPDVPGVRSELVVPLLEGSEVLGALDFQSEQPFAFALDDVAAGETLAEFLVIALRNARLYQEARRGEPRS
jgi:putative methionine-R-sulfoxide reductase with GAF domain